MPTAAEVIARMRAAAHEPKVVAGHAGWKDGNRPGKLVIAFHAEGGSGSSELHISAIASLPNENVTFQLCMAEPDTTYPVMRFDWRPPNMHVNKFGRLRGICSETGLHAFEENAELGLEMMASHNLPVCVPVEPDPPDFESALAYVCATFRITFLNSVDPPPWSPSLI